MDEIIVKEQGFLSDISDELTNRLVAESHAIGSGFNSQRFIMNSLEAIKQLDLMDKPITPKQVAECLMKGAYLNLDFFRKECYLIFYKGKGLQFQTDYKGEIKLVKKHSIKPIFEIYADVVREGDLYEKITINNQRAINHKPLRFNDGGIEGAYAVVKYTDGSSDLVEISKKDIEVIRTQYSKAPNSGAWTNRYVEMCKKTALRLLCKYIQLDFSREQFIAYNDGGDCEFSNTTQTVETAVNPFATKLITTSPPQEIETVEDEVPQTTSTVEIAEERKITIAKVCSSCGIEIGDRVYEFSMNKFKKPLCYNCQQELKQNG